MRKTIAQYELEVVQLRHTNSQLNDKLREANNEIALLQDGTVLKQAREALETAEDKIEGFSAAQQEGDDALEVVNALSGWFEKRGLDYWQLDHETALLYRQLYPA